MRYALLIYGNSDVLDQISEEELRTLNAGFAEVVARPDVTGYLRLENVGLATTIRDEQGTAVLTDGPFVESKDFLGGLIFVEAADLDEALAVGTELQEMRLARAIEIRPVNEEELLHA